jgi:transposase
MFVSKTTGAVGAFALGIVCAALNSTDSLCAQYDYLRIPAVVICPLDPTKSFGVTGVCPGCVISVLFDEGRKEHELTEILGVSRGTVYNVRKKYQQKGQAPILDLLPDAPRSGRPITLDSRVEAKVTMIACSTPPTGRGRWTLQLIADKVVELAVTESISYESVRRVLKKTNSSRG